MAINSSGTIVIYDSSLQSGSILGKTGVAANINNIRFDYENCSAEVQAKLDAGERGFDVDFEYLGAKRAGDVALASGAFLRSAAFIRHMMTNTASDSGAAAEEPVTTVSFNIEGASITLKGANASVTVSVESASITVSTSSAEDEVDGTEEAENGY